VIGHRPAYVANGKRWGGAAVAFNAADA